MGITAAVTAVTSAYDTAKKVYEASKTLQNAELKLLIAELATQLADANLQMAELKTEMVRLHEENRVLKEKRDGVKPEIQWGCYKFEGEKGLYCPACFDTKGKKHLTTRINSQSRRCSVCQAVLGSG